MRDAYLVLFSSLLFIAFFLVPYAYFYGEDRSLLGRSASIPARGFRFLALKIDEDHIEWLRLKPNGAASVGEARPQGPREVPVLECR